MVVLGDSCTFDEAFFPPASRPHLSTLVCALQPFSNPLAGQEAAEDNSGADNNPLFAGSSSPATKLNFKPAGTKK